MNFPGVIQGDPDMPGQNPGGPRARKRVDGHAPASGGRALAAYIAAGIASDHECIDGRGSP